MPICRPLLSFSPRSEVLATPPKVRCHATTLPSYAPLLILSTAMKYWDPQDGRGFPTIMLHCKPLLILSTRSKALVTRQLIGVIQLIRPLVGYCCFCSPL